MAELIVSGVFMLVGIFFGCLTTLFGVAMGSAKTRKEEDK